MSGGLDSSYSVVALREAGCEVFGTTLIMHGYTDSSGARECAAKFGVPFSIVDCRTVFAAEVMKYFAGEYSSGRTPNPCVVCNRKVKFASLIAEADRLGCELVATGHYARTGFENGRYFISRGEDPKKDQSYMLWNLSQEQIPRVIFPLGEMKKSDVRTDARSCGISAADAPESEDVCFIPDGNIPDFVRKYSGELPEGDFINSKGEPLGHHKGIDKYTIGQRRGLGISAGKRIFVTKIDPENNTVTLGNDNDLYSRKIYVSGINFQKAMPTDGKISGLSVKVRYAAPPVFADVTVSGNSAVAVLDSPARAVAPGQSAVFFDGGDIAFGGVIERCEN